MAPEVMVLPEEATRDTDTSASAWDAYATRASTLGTTEYTLHADVYSVGLLLWAIAARRFPFDDLERSADVFRAVKAGVRPPMPAGALRVEPLATWFNVVAFCWAHAPQERPSMEQICGVFELLQQSSVQLLDAHDIDDPFSIVIGTGEGGGRI